MGVYLGNKFRRMKPVCYWKIKLWSWIWLCLGAGLAGVLATGCAGHAMAPGPVSGQRERLGARIGDYEVIRYNAEDRADPALNQTLALRLDGASLVISVRDSELTGNVLLDVRYDAARVHPVATRFHCLLGAPSQVLSAAFMDQAAGLAGIGECAIGDFKPGPLGGDFASVTFAPGALRTASAAGDVYLQPAGVGYVIEPQTFAPGFHNFQAVYQPGQFSVKWWGAWARADCNQNGVCDIGDLLAIAFNFGCDVSRNPFYSVVGDCDNDGQIDVSDLVPLGKHFGERCDAYLVQASDNQDGVSRVPVMTVEYQQGKPREMPAAYPNLDSLFRSWQVDFSDDSEFSLQQLVALDAAGNADGGVRIYVTPLDTTAPLSPPGITSYIGLGTGQEVAQVLHYEIRAAGATGGTGTHSDIFSDGEVGVVVANQELALKLLSVSGTWSNEPFDAEHLPLSMTQADYDAIHAAMAANLSWEFTNNDAPDLRYVSSWFTPYEPSYAGVGDPSLGRVFSDDSLFMDTANPEGLCATTLQAGEIYTGTGLPVFVPSTLLCHVQFDVAPDPRAPLNEGYYSEPELLNELHSLDASPGATTNVYCNMLNWGASGQTMPANGPDWQVWLCNVYPNGEVTILTTLMWDTGADNDPEPGEFSFFHASAPLDKDVFVAEIPGIWLAQGSYFTLRIFDGATWSSLNKPFDLLDTIPPG